MAHPAVPTDAAATAARCHSTRSLRRLPLAWCLSRAHQKGGAGTEIRPDQKAGTPLGAAIAGAAPVAVGAPTRSLRWDQKVDEQGKFRTHNRVVSVSRAFLCFAVHHASSHLGCLASYAASPTPRPVCKMLGNGRPSGTGIGEKGDTDRGLLPLIDQQFRHRRKLRNGFKVLPTLSVRPLTRTKQNWPRLQSEPGTGLLSSVNAAPTAPVSSRPEAGKLVAGRPLSIGSYEQRGQRLHLHAPRKRCRPVGRRRAHHRGHRRRLSPGASRCWSTREVLVRCGRQGLTVLSAPMRGPRPCPSRFRAGRRR